MVSGWQKLNKKR